MISFEPEPENFRILLANLANNGMANFRAVESAVGHFTGRANLTKELNSIGTHSLISTDSRLPTIEVRTITLDEYFQDIPGRVGLLKVDVEGYEPYVMAGAHSLLMRTDYVLFEYSRPRIKKNLGLDHLLRQLQDFEFIYGIDPRSGALKRFVRSHFESTHYINVIASRHKLNSGN